jgi:NAD/NADP transhydrogenase beta subunit
VLLGKTTSAARENPFPDNPGDTAARPQESGEDSERIVSLLKTAKTVIVIPGYGMALSQAQHQVKQLCDILEKQGKDVKFAIHPVAGRMPGHMNVLLAEADVPYEKIFDMDSVNPFFPDTDVVIIIGANDVVNPAATTEAGTPIYGMPILHAGEAKNIIIFNKDTRPGYAGVNNPLYSRGNTQLCLGDAAGKIGEIIKKLNE